MRFNQFQARGHNDIGGAMTDISFLLIIFFLVTAVFVGEEGLLSNLPKDDTKPKSVQRNNILKVSMIDNDTIKVNDTLFTNREETISYIKNLYNQNTDLVGFLIVKEGITYGNVVTLLSSIKDIGVSRFTTVSGDEENYSSKLFPIEVPDYVDEVSAQ